MKNFTMFGLELAHCPAFIQFSQLTEHIYFTIHKSGKSMQRCCIHFSRNVLKSFSKTQFVEVVKTRLCAKHAQTRFEQSDREGRISGIVGRSASYRLAGRTATHYGVI